MKTTLLSAVIVKIMHSTLRITGNRKTRHQLSQCLSRQLGGRCICDMVYSSGCSILKDVIELEKVYPRAIRMFKGLEYLGVPRKFKSIEGSFACKILLLRNMIAIYKIMGQRK